MRTFLTLLLGTIAFFLLEVGVFGSAIPGKADALLQPPSIVIGTPVGGDVFETTREIGFSFLTAAKVFVSGMALIYIILLGAYMIIFSENEDRIKSQRRQLTYVLIGFLFLNIPGLIYIIFFGDEMGRSRVMPSIGDPGPIDFWDSTTLTGINGFYPDDYRIFRNIYIRNCYPYFTWGLFRLLISSGNEEYQKKAKNRIIYGVFGLLFVGFARYWGSVIAKGDFFGEVATVSRRFLGLALYFAAPVVVGFLVIAAFYMITSAGDEERVKKAKSIFTNTLIASVILLGAYSFITDIASFNI